MMKFKRRLQGVVACLFSAIVAFSSFACGKKDKTPTLPEYASQEFVFYGYWSPYELTNESFSLYKESGLNTMFFTNHSVRPWTSDTLHYLGSNATERSLELCKSVGLNAIINYGDWYKESIEGVSFGEKPFSDYDLYGNYKDIIVGVNIVDEPTLDKMSDYGKQSLTEDFKKVYDVPYMVNLFPNYASRKQIGSKGYRNYLQAYSDEVLADFDKNRLVSVDFYPFRKDGFSSGWLACYSDVANFAKATGSKQNYYIQTAVGNEFQAELSALEIALQLNVAMAFGADSFGFYCYETPITYYSDADYEPMYKYCMLNPDGTPSPLYYAVQGEIARVSTFSKVYLSYDWVKTVPVHREGVENQSQALLMLGDVDFSQTLIKGAKSTEDAIIGCFNSNYGQAFMVVNYGNPNVQNNATVEIELSKGEYAAVYGNDAAPQIVELTDGKLTLNLLTGEGCFITTL